MSEYLLVKRGMYYRPDSAGYTALKSEAGRYNVTDAMPDAGVIAVHENDADPVAPAAPYDAKLKHRISFLEAENARLRKALEAIRDDEVKAIPHPHFSRMCRHQLSLEMDDCWECLDAHIDAALGDSHD